MYLLLPLIKLSLLALVVLSWLLSLVQLSLWLALIHSPLLKLAWCRLSLLYSYILTRTRRELVWVISRSVRLLLRWWLARRLGGRLLREVVALPRVSRGRRGIVRLRERTLLGRRVRVRLLRLGWLLLPLLLLRLRAGLLKLRLVLLLVEILVVLIAPR